jgi:predicted ATP-grasp superfamily ATP-dependent carboligase
MIAGDIAGTSALITDIDRRKALPIIRSLGKKGVRVIGISYNRLPMGWFSRYCAKVYLCPDYRLHPDKFLDELERICRLEKPDVFYPIEDVVLSLCVQHPERWKPHTRALLPGPAELERAYDKWQTIQVAQSVGVPVPRSYCPDTIHEVSGIPHAESNEWVIKPRKGSGSRGVRYVENHAQLLSVYQEVSRKYPRPIIQERIPSGGSAVGVFFLLGNDRKPLAVFSHRRIREYPITGGPSTLCESFRDDALIRQSLKLVKELDCIGVSMVEYKFDSRSNQYLLMEVNPRFWGSLQLAIYASVDFPALYHMATLGMKVEPVLEYPLGLYSRWLWPGDILHFLANPERFHLQPSFFKFRDPKLTYDISWNDPGPILGIVIEGLRKLINKER